MKNIKNYTDHLRESIENLSKLDNKLFRELSSGNPSLPRIKMLIKAGANINCKDYLSMTPLHRAAINGYTDVARFLIDAGAIVDAKCTNDSTPLYRAAFHGHTDLARLLIEAGADPDAKDKYGQTLLHPAAWEGHTEIIRLLIDLGANVNAEDDNGYTALYCSVVEKMKSTARLLIEAGAEIASAFNTLDELEEFFDGDISWIPQQSLPPEWRKKARSRGAFGRF